MNISSLSSLVQLDILFNIASNGEEIYWLLRRAIPLFRHAVSAEQHKRFLAQFGYSVRSGPNIAIWEKNSITHRLDGPAISWIGVGEEWYVHGRRHRIIGPAVKKVNGVRKWYLHGVLHRTDGPAIEEVNGDREWYAHGVLHRTDGPAVTKADGTHLWYQNGKLHRTNGPAVIRADGTMRWYWFGIMYNSEAERKRSRAVMYDDRVVSGRDNQRRMARPTRAAHRHR